MALARIYARASTKEQEASRALADLESFAAEHGLPIAARYIENESGTKLDRPELRRLLRDAAPGDVLLVEQVDRLSRLTDTDWRALRAEIEAKGPSSGEPRGIHYSLATKSLARNLPSQATLRGPTATRGAAPCALKICFSRP